MGLDHLLLRTKVDCYYNLYLGWAQINDVAYIVSLSLSKCGVGFFESFSDKSQERIPRLNERGYAWVIQFTDDKWRLRI